MVLAFACSKRQRSITYAMKNYYTKTDWDRYQDDLSNIRKWVELREWKLFLTLRDKKVQPNNPSWRSTFARMDLKGYDSRESVTRQFMSCLRCNLGCRDNQYYWLARHELGKFKDDPHIHILVDFTAKLDVGTIEWALAAIENCHDLNKNGYDLCWRLKNNEAMPAIIRDLNVVKNYFCKDESRQLGAAMEHWCQSYEQQVGSSAFCCVAFSKQINGLARLVS